jgi:RNA ligase (TIGR02306 family)
MSTFAVERRRLAEILPHPNADRLDLCRVEGLSYQFVTQKGKSVGEEVIYFPIDSLLPEALQIRLNLQSPRIKTIKLRGCISQGLCVPVSDFPELEGVEDITAALGVVKYEPPVPMTKDIYPLPGCISKYDIEGCDRYATVVDLLMDQVVWISEKVEGTHYSITCTKDGNVVVGQRNFAVKEDNNVFWNTTKKLKLDKLIEHLYLQYGCCSDVTLRGELIGPKIQGNYYELKEPTVLLFDLSVNGEYVKVYDFIDAVPISYGVNIVPTLSHFITLREWLKGVTVQEASNGPSCLIEGKVREGIVIKPLEEQWNEEVGRLMLKQRSPVYLSKTDY